MEYLTLGEVYLLHERLIQLTGGGSGLRDPGLLESAVARPQASSDGDELYPDLRTKAAVLMQALIKNHSIVDRNKRTAVTATAIFSELNHHRLSASNDEVLRFAVQTAGGQAELEGIATWLEEHSSPACPRDSFLHSLPPEAPDRRCAGRGGSLLQLQSRSRASLRETCP